MKTSNPFPAIAVAAVLAFPMAILIGPLITITALALSVAVTFSVAHHIERNGRTGESRTEAPADEPATEPTR